LMSEPAKIRTSWNTAKDLNLAVRGRTGYSVKFVSLKSLTSSGASEIPGDGKSAAMSNFLPNTSDDGDIPNGSQGVQH
jgi:hypothetical protein